MEPPPPVAWAAAGDPADADPLEVRCAGCGETLEVDRGLTEFICPDCATPQSLPPELMPPRRRKALPLPRGAADVRGARLPCGACGALLSVPVGLPRCACPICGAELAVDTARLRNYLLSSAAAADAVPVLPLGASSSVPPILQTREAQTEHPNRLIPEQAQSGHPDYTVNEEEIRVNEDTARYKEQRNIYSGVPRIVGAENRHGGPLNQVGHQAQDLPSSHAVRTKKTYEESPDQVTEALRNSANPALYRESWCISHINDTTTTDINGTAGHSICPKTVNLEKRNMQTPKQIMQKPQKQLPCNVKSPEHAQAQSANRAIHVQEKRQEPGNEANHRENACTQLGDETIADNNNRRITEHLIGHNAMGAEKRRGQPNDATQLAWNEQYDSVIHRELDNQVTCVENKQPGQHRVQKRKRKGLMAASNSGLQLTRRRRLAKFSSSAIDRQPVIDDKLTESEPDEQWTASPDIQPVIDDKLTESEPNEEGGQQQFQQQGGLQTDIGLTSAGHRSDQWGGWEQHRPRRSNSPSRKFLNLLFGICKSQHDIEVEHQRSTRAFKKMKDSTKMMWNIAGLQPPCSPISPSPPEVEIPSFEDSMRGWANSGMINQYGSMFFSEQGGFSLAPPPPPPPHQM